MGEGFGCGFGEVGCCVGQLFFFQIGEGDVDCGVFFDSGEVFNVGVEDFEYVWVCMGDLSVVDI